MTITIKINTGNAAFEDKEAEVTRIITNWLARGIRDAGLMDYNGNRVGTVKVTGK
jgi:hypothetical protein